MSTLTKEQIQKYSSVGCYPLFYLDSEDSVLCCGCASESVDDMIEKFRPVSGHVNWEDPTLFCNCGERIESAYADDDESEDNKS